MTVLSQYLRQHYKILVPLPEIFSSIKLDHEQLHLTSIYTELLGYSLAAKLNISISSRIRLVLVTLTCYSTNLVQRLFFSLKESRTPGQVVLPRQFSMFTTSDCQSSQPLHQYRQGDSVELLRKPSCDSCHRKPTPLKKHAWYRLVLIKLLQVLH